MSKKSLKKFNLGQFYFIDFQMFQFPVKRLLAIWIWPILATTLIISDWRTMKNLKKNGHTTIFDAIRDENTSTRE